MEKRADQLLRLLGSVIGKTEGPMAETEDIDEIWLYEQAQEQNLVPLVYEALSKNRWIQRISHEIAEQMEEGAVLGTISQMKKTEAFLRIYKKLREAGIKVLVLKGIVCRMAYGKYADYRPSGDEDIWIKAEDFAACERVLKENGYVCEDSESMHATIQEVQEISFYQEESDLELEVHINLMGKYSSLDRKMNEAMQGAFTESYEITVQGSKIETLSPTNHMKFLLLHFEKHFLAAGVGIRQMMDLLLFSKQYMAVIDWNEIEQLVKEFHMESLVGDVFELGKIYFGITPPLPLPGKHPERLIEDMLESGVFGIGTKEHALAAQMTLASQEGKERGSFIKTVFPSLNRMRQGYPELYKHPWMLPLAWGKRLCKFVGYYRKWKRDGENLAAESVAISQKRLSLIQEYGMIEGKKK